jgi:hypothetical protein
LVFIAVVESVYSAVQAGSLYKADFVLSLKGYQPLVLPWYVVVAALLVVVWPDHDQQHCYHHAPTVKPEAANAVVSS